IKVVLAEDNYLVREGVRQMLESHEDIEISDAVADLDALMAAVEQHKPDVVITDIRMPPSHTDEGIKASEWLREKHPDTGVVVLSQYAEPGYALALLEKG